MNGKNENSNEEQEQKPTEEVTEPSKPEPPPTTEYVIKVDKTDHKTRVKK